MEEGRGQCDCYYRLRKLPKMIRIGLGMDSQLTDVGRVGMGVLGDKEFVDTKDRGRAVYFSVLAKSNSVTSETCQAP
jgi:hypothetical protein